MAQNRSDKSRALLKNQNFEILDNEICSIFSIDYLVFYVLDQNFDFLRKTDRFWANVLYVLEFFLGRITTKNLALCPWEITEKSFRRKLLKFFHFLTLWIWLFGIFDKRPQGCHEVKNSMGLLQGPRMMAWTTISPILENHWVPWGCMAHLGSVKPKMLVSRPKILVHLFYEI